MKPPYNTPVELIDHYMNQRANLEDVKRYCQNKMNKPRLNAELMELYRSTITHIERMESNDTSI